MRVQFIVHVSPETESRLFYAAEELGIGVITQARLCIDAAAKLWCEDAGTPAIPCKRIGEGRSVGDVRLNLYFGDHTAAVMGYVAIDRNVPLEEVLRRVLDAAVATYDPPRRQPPEPEPETAVPPRPPGNVIVAGGGVPHRAPFDPKDYAGSRAVGTRIAAEQPRASLTAEMMGDPAARVLACARRDPVRRESAAQSRRRPPEGDGDR